MAVEQELPLTALQAAAAAGDSAALTAAIGQGGAIDSTDPFGRSALIMAAFDPETDCGYPECVKLLLEAGANPNHQMHFGNTALMIAAGAGETEVCQVLLAHGANPNLTNEAGLTALRMAYLTHRIDVVYLLQDVTQEQLLGEGKEEETACSTAQNKLKTTASVVQFVRKPELGTGSASFGGGEKPTLN